MNGKMQYLHEGNHFVTNFAILSPISRCQVLLPKPGANHEHFTKFFAAVLGNIVLTFVGIWP